MTKFPELKIPPEFSKFFIYFHWSILLMSLWRPSELGIPWSKVSYISIVGIFIGVVAYYFIEPYLENKNKDVLDMINEENYFIDYLVTWIILGFVYLGIFLLIV